MRVSDLSLGFVYARLPLGDNLGHLVQLLHKLLLQSLGRFQVTSPLLQLGYLKDNNRYKT